MIHREFLRGQRGRFLGTGVEGKFEWLSLVRKSVPTRLGRTPNEERPDRCGGRASHNSEYPKSTATNHPAKFAGRGGGGCAAGKESTRCSYRRCWS